MHAGQLLRGALGTTFCWGVKEAELGKEELNWVAGATQTSHNLMGALELAWPFGLGPNEARRLGLRVPHVQSLDVGGNGGARCLPSGRGSSWRVSALSPPQPTLPAAGGTRMVCHGVYCQGFALSVWRLFG